MGMAIPPVLAGLYGAALYTAGLFGLCVLADKGWAVKLARWRGYDGLVEIGEYDPDDEGDSA
jgi:hypothetical protein